MPTNKPTVRHRGRCPVCLREMSLLSDGRIAKAHRCRCGIAWCPGYGQKALPTEVMP